MENFVSNSSLHKVDIGNHFCRGIPVDTFFERNLEIVIESCNLSRCSIYKFPDQFSTLSRSFSGLEIWFLERIWKIVHFHCESWSGTKWALREGPAGVIELYNGIKMVKMATFLTSSPTFLGNFLVWKSGLWKLYGKSFHFQCVSWSDITWPCRWSPRRAEESGLLTTPWRGLNFFRIDQPSTLRGFYVPF